MMVSRGAVRRVEPTSSAYHSACRLNRRLGPTGSVGDSLPHAQSITFWHLPPNSVRTGYVTEGALISAQLYSDAVGALQNVWVFNKTVKATDDFGFIYGGVSNVDGYKRNV